MDSPSAACARTASAVDDIVLAKLLQQQELFMYQLSQGNSGEMEQASQSSGDMHEDEPQDDEEFARRLQQQEEILAGGFSSTSYADFEETLHNAPDIDDLQYEDLQQVSDIVGTVSKGLAVETLAKLPRQAYSKSLAGSVDSDRCCVCQCEYEESDDVMPLPCGHVYHVCCITQWFERNKTCPCCNKEISLAAEESPAAASSVPPAK